MGQISRHFAQIAGTAFLLVGGAPALAQEASSASKGFTFGLSSTLRSNDNMGLRAPSAGTVTLWDNRLSFGAFSETQRSRISLDLGATIRTTSLPGQAISTTIDDPSATLAYRLENPNAVLELDAHYNQISLDFADPLRLIADNPDGGVDDRDLSRAGGTRLRYGATARFEGGQADPMGYGLSVTHDRTEYRNATSTGLYDSRSTDVNGFLRLRFSPVVETTLSAFWAKTDTQDAEQRSRRTIGTALNLRYEIDPITVASFELGYREIEETTLSTGLVASDGLTGSVLLSRDIPTGNVSAEISRSRSIRGQRDTFQLSGVFERPAGEISATVGVTRADGRPAQWIGRLAARHDLARGTILTTLERSVRTTGEGTENIADRASISYETELTPTTSFSIGFDYAELSDVGSVQTSALTGANASYTFELTPDWALETGYEYRKRAETTQVTRDSNEIFLTLRRDFGIR